MSDSVTPSLQKVLSQVPQPLAESGSAREKLEAVWRIVGWSRSGIQTRVAGDVAERWHDRRESPRIPVDDPRKAARKLDRIMTGELAMPLDLALVIIDCLPAPYDQAARALVFPFEHNAGGQLDEVLTENAQIDNVTDAHRFRLARGSDAMSRAELVAIAQAYEEEARSCRRLAEELYAAADVRKRTA